MTESPLQRLNMLKLKSVKSRLESLTYKAPKYGAAVGEVISGSLGRGEGGKFANIEDIKRASMSNDPLSVFQGSQRRMFQTFYNAFTRDSPFKQDLDASQKKVADLLAASGGNWTDEVKAAQAASDELWRLDGAYRRNMMTGDTGLKPSGVSVKIEGFNSDKTGAGQSVADIMKAAGKDPEGMAKGIGERLIQDAYNYMSVFNQRDELKKLNNASPEFNLTTLPEGQKYRIDEEALKNGKLKVDFAYSADQPDGPSKDDITAAMSDIMMKLDPNIEQYAASFAQANPNFKIGKDGMVKDVLQQAMASLNDDPQKMALENPDLFKFALSAAQGVNLFEGEAGGQAVPTPSVEPKPTGETPPAPTPGPTPAPAPAPAPTPGPTPAPQPKPIDPSKYPGNDVEAGLEQDYVMPTFNPSDVTTTTTGPSVPEYVENRVMGASTSQPMNSLVLGGRGGRGGGSGSESQRLAWQQQNEALGNTPTARARAEELSRNRGLSEGEAAAQQKRIDAVFPPGTVFPKFLQEAFDLVDKNRLGGYGTKNDILDAAITNPSALTELLPASGPRNRLLEMVNTAQSNRRGATVSASGAAVGPIIGAGGEGPRPGANQPAYITDSADNLWKKYNEKYGYMGFENEIMKNPQVAQRKFNLTDNELNTLLNSRNYGQTRSTPASPTKKPVYPQRTTSTTRPANPQGEGSRFNVTGSANQPNLTIASVSAKLPKGTNPMFVASAIRSNPSLAAKYGLTSSEARMLMQYYAE